jgi:hypothetical protein
MIEPSIKMLALFQLHSEMLGEMDQRIVHQTGSKNHWRCTTRSPSLRAVGSTSSSGMASEASARKQITRGLSTKVHEVMWVAWVAATCFIDLHAQPEQRKQNWEWYRILENIWLGNVLNILVRFMGSIPFGYPKSAGDIHSAQIPWGLVLRARRCYVFWSSTSSRLKQ